MPAENDDETARVSTDAWPIVVVAAPRRLTVASMEAMFARIEPIYARGEPYALITDTRQVSGVPGAVERKRLAEILARPVHVVGQEKWNIGSATILNSAILRGAMQAMYWLWTPPRPHCAARDFDEAWTFCVRLLEQRGVTLAAKERELRLVARRVLER